jgi:exosortase/archaeosortase family protein
MPNKKRDFISRYNGLAEFVIKCLLFLGVFFIESFFIIFFTEPVISNSTAANILSYNLGLTNPLNIPLSKYLVCVYLIVVFALISRKKLSIFKFFSFDSRSSITYLVINIMLALALLIFRIFTASNTWVIENLLWLVILAKYGLPIFMAIFLVLAIFGLDTLKYFFKNFTNELLISAFFAFAFFAYRELVYSNWQIFTKGVMVVISLFGAVLPLNISYSDASTLTVNDLSLSIHQACSGIESQMLFLLLFLMIIFFDWEEINKVKAFILLVPGLVGMFLVNTLRVFLLYMIGIFYSVEFAVGGFHSNIGWILFVLYFVGFQYLTYNFIRK